MKNFEYGDQEISGKELAYAVISMTIAVGILTLPRTIAQVTEYFDGAVSLLIGSAVALCLIWISVKLASMFPKQSFYSYVKVITNRPIAFMLTAMMALFFAVITAYEIRMLTNISAVYLFNQTPPEVIGLTFFLTVIYAVSGTNNGVFRLNLMFLPIFMTVLFLLLILNVRLIQFDHFLPFFTTSWLHLLKASVHVAFNLFGLYVVLHYVSFLNRPQKAMRSAVIGLSVTILINFLIYFFVIGQLGKTVTENVLYPTIEMAKETEVPGEFFARFDSLFFTVWIMAIFNTTTMSLHICILSLRSLLSKRKKLHLILIVSPVIFLMAMIPVDLIQVGVITNWIMVLSGILGLIIPAGLLIIAKVRGVKGNV